MLRLSKRQLDNLSTLLGLVAAITGVLVANQIEPIKFWSVTSGLALAVLGYLTNKPATAVPTTSDLERGNIHGS